MYGSINTKIGAVTVLYNPSIKLLQESIKSFIDSVDFLFLIDNSESEVNFDFISNEKIEYIKIGKNIGIAAALNMGLQLCRRHNLDYILTMDQDTIFTPSLSYFPTHLFDEHTLALYPNVKLDSGQILAIKPIQSGAIFSINALDKIGNFCEKYFIDYVDYEIFSRGKNAGLKVLNNPNIFIRHKNGDNYIGRFLFWQYKYTFSSPIRMYYQTRNAVDYIIKYKDYSLLIIVLKLILKTLLISDRKKERMKYIILGINDWRTNKWGKYDG